MRKLLYPAILGLMVIVLALGSAALSSRAADQLAAPGTMPPGGDTRLDINDVYAFQSPANAANTVLIMTVNPLAGMLNNGTFHPDASYDLPIDTNGDAKEDLMYRITFSAPDASLVQDVRLRLVGAGAGSGVLASGQTGQNIPVAGGGMLRAGVFDDPFFFDLVGFLSLNLCNP